MNGVFETKDKRMKAYYNKVTKLVKWFWRIDIQAKKRELNTRVDGLSKGAVYGEYEKKKKITTQDSCLADVNMIDAKEETKAEVAKDS